MCPTGYRASERARVGSDRRGNRVVYDDTSYVWRVEQEVDS